LPAVVASKIAKCVTVPHDADAVGNVIAAALSVSPVVADAPVQLASSGATLTRAYAPPVTSVPPPASDGAAETTPRPTPWA